MVTESVVLQIVGSVSISETMKYVDDIEKEINNINPKKATTSNSIPPKILIKSSKVSDSVLHKLFNDSIEKSDFPQNLKLADITPVYKKNEQIIDLLAYYP